MLDRLTPIRLAASVVVAINLAYVSTGKVSKGHIRRFLFPVLASRPGGSFRISRPLFRFQQDALGATAGGAMDENKETKNLSRPVGES